MGENPKRMHGCLKVALGFRLKLARDNKLLTQAELAKLIGQSNTNVWRIENGKAFPAVSTLIAMCHALQVSADYLLGLPENYTGISWLK